MLPVSWHMAKMKMLGLRPSLDFGRDIFILLAFCFCQYLSYKEVLVALSKKHVQKLKFLNRLCSEFSDNLLISISNYCYLDYFDIKFGLLDYNFIQFF